eukprot:NODE_1694_length_872_cov_52.995140_g1332_i0.p1 GENE.NODE_1694_length_872_cov_52.995140_g1332_i0~~NODE_1694_length_872_cov_52.995140_g1332_i0.p1  ORF type:complete len:264 (+),score=37.38 NODE_1694_length_872_cov_52.995140_g1332_i0:50-841(+)
MLRRACLLLAKRQPHSARNKRQPVLQPRTATSRVPLSHLLSAPVPHLWDSPQTVLHFPFPNWVQHCSVLGGASVSLGSLTLYWIARQASLYAETGMWPASADWGSPAIGAIGTLLAIFPYVALGHGSSLQVLNPSHRRAEWVFQIVRYSPLPQWVPMPNTTTFTFKDVQWVVCEDNQLNICLPGPKPSKVLVLKLLCDTRALAEGLRVMFENERLGRLDTPAPSSFGDRLPRMMKYVPGAMGLFLAVTGLMVIYRIYNHLFSD